MKKLNENQFIDITNNIVNQHYENSSASFGSKESNDVFNFLNQSFCELLWRLTEPQDKYLKEHLQYCVGTITGNINYSHKYVTYKKITSKQCSELVTELPKMDKHLGIAYSKTHESELTHHKTILMLCELLKEHLPE